jgi:hypothetical protein
LRLAAEAKAADARGIRVRDDAIVFACVIAVTVGNVASFASAHRIDVETEALDVERGAVEREHASNGRSLSRVDAPRTLSACVAVERHTMVRRPQSLTKEPPFGTHLR